MDKKEKNLGQNIGRCPWLVKGKMSVKLKELREHLQRAAFAGRVPVSPPSSTQASEVEKAVGLRPEWGRLLFLVNPIPWFRKKWVGRKVQVCQ